MHGTAPEYLTEMFMSVTDDPGHRRLRSAAHDDINVPQTNTETLGRRRFAVYGPVIWASGLYLQH